MSNGKTKNIKPQSAAGTPPSEPAAPVAPATPGHPPRLFRRVDWFTFAVTTLFVLAGYYYTLAPNLTLEDSGELAVASMYAGIPHPPGYPVWTLYTWLWTLLPFSNIAWRVALGEATAGALACGLLGLLVSRGSSMMMEGIAGLKNIERRWENSICVVSGFVAGMLLGFNGYMWSQSIIVEVYSFSVLSLMAVMLGLLRWVYAPFQHRYLYLAFFMYGICFNNHQSLLVIALGMEALVIVVEPKLARELFFWNSLIFILGLVAGPSLLTGNTPVLVIYIFIGLISLVTWVILLVTTKKRGIELGRDFAMVGAFGYIAVVFLSATNYINFFDHRKGLFALVHLVGIALIVGFVRLAQLTRKSSREWLVTLACGGSWLAGAAFYLYMPIAGATNPPMQWGYPRTLEGFIHAITRGQYERIKPTSGTGDNLIEQFSSFVITYAKQAWMYLEGLIQEFHWVYVLIALVMFFYYRRMQKRERAWTLGIAAIFFCLGPFLIVLLNPPPDRQARELIRVFFTASHVFVSLGVGYGLTLIAATLATNFEKVRVPALLASIVALDLAFFSVAVRTHDLLGADIAVSSDPMFNLLKWVFVIVGLAAVALAVLRVSFSQDSISQHVPLLTTLGCLAFLCFFTSLPTFMNESNGVVAATIAGFAKIACWFLAGVALYFAGKPQRDGDRPAMLGVAGLMALISIGLTLVTVLGDQPGFQGISTFIRYLSRAFEPGQNALPIFAALVLMGMIIVFGVAVYLRRSRAPLGVILAIFALMPFYSFTSNWFDNEQRNHMFGYWFGHDMFTPPFTGPDGKLTYDPKLREEMMKDPEKAKFIYPEMARNAVLYGGTDPGRFCPTYMIFCESFIPPECKADTDPNFDRRDVYIITQNALADGTYLNYIRAHYNRSEQLKYDSPFFQQLLRGPSERAPVDSFEYETNWIARVAGNLLDKPLNKIGAAIEARRREQGVYPKNEIYIASPEDSQRCLQEYLADAQRRLAHDQQFPNEPPQIRPGEDVRVVDNRVQVSGQVAVMTINGLITKVMFDKNPTNEFYVEESFPLDWMYPHLTPFGIIMKINRQPLPTLTEEILQRDHEFWSKYSERLVGNWITYDTPISEIVDFVEKVYLRRDFSGFKGDPKFARDEQAQKAFSKLRSSIGGVYAWRLSPQCQPEYRPKTPEEFERIRKEADFAFRQAFAFCPYSPEAVFRYVQLLTQFNRMEDALMVAEACRKLDPYNMQVVGLVERLKTFRNNAAELEKMQKNLQQLEADVQNNPTNFQAAFNLASMYIQLQQIDRAVVVLERLLNNPQSDASVFRTIFQAYASFGTLSYVQSAVQRLETRLQTNSANAAVALGLAEGYRILQQPDRGTAVLDRLLESDSLTPRTVREAAQYFIQIGNREKVERALEKLVQVQPGEPEAWYDLANFRVSIGKIPEGIQTLSTALDLSNRRLATNANARDLMADARSNIYLNSIRHLPEFQKLVPPK